MFSISVNICAMLSERSCLSWTLIAGLSPSAFSSRSLAASGRAARRLHHDLHVGDAVLWCGASVALSSMMPWISSLPS